MKSAQQVLACSLVFFPALNSYAQDVQPNTLDLGVSADYASTDNALRASSEQAKLREGQAIYGANFDATYRNDWSRLVSTYELRKETFQKDSQPSATEFEGQTQYTLGNEYQPLNLLVSHARVVMLDSPDSLDLAVNRDVQEIVTVSPSAKTHLSPADSIVLMGTYADVSYKEEEQKESEQKGVQLAWVRGVSKTDTVQVTLQRMDTEFEYVPEADYQLESASAQYEVSLKRLNYSLQAGYSSATIKASEDDFSSPTYKIQSSYVSGAHTFAMLLSKEITNSSMGVGGRSSLDGINTGSGTPAKGVGIDLINVNSADISWNTSALCERCNVGISVNQSRQDYQSLPEDGDEVGASANFQYSFTRSTSMSLSVNHRQRNFSGESARAKFDSDGAKIELNYAITRDLKLKLYGQLERRTSLVAVQNYEENIIGLNLYYHLF